jgi:apolipoprotein D and lipocalin family protein
MNQFARRVLIILFVAVAAGCTFAPVNRNPHADKALEPVSVDLSRYMGRWYVISNIPVVDERDYVGSCATWTLREDGRIEDAVLGRKHGFDQPETGSVFIARPEHGARNSVWKIRPVRPFEFVVLTVYLDPDYEYTVRATPDKNFAWILARHPEMREETYQAVLTRLDAMGFDIARFKKVVQFPEQIGKPGFHSVR